MSAHTMFLLSRGASGVLPNGAVLVVKEFHTEM